MARFNHLEPRLHVADFTRSVAFYRDVLGFSVEATFPEDDPSFAILSRDGVGLQIGGIDARKSREERPTCTLYFDVTDALGLHEQLKSRIPIEWGPEVYFYHRREFAIRDPDGHLVILSEETDDPVTATE
ncbi:MAG TPA: VOC family protein [Vicinamibacterales bacterium]|jgi:catechol 2,3-dioxygenase-like lactoylglutathione lyase family enzyme